MYSIARALGERGFVGRLYAGSPHRDSRREHIARESLRCLREIHGVARNGLDNDGRARLERDTLHRIACLDRRDRRAVRLRRVDRPLDQRGADERPRGVVNQHDLGVGADAIERGRHRVLAAIAAGHGVDLGPTAVLPFVRQQSVRRSISRQDDDDFRDQRMRVKRAQAVLEHRPAADVEHLLRRGRPEPASCAGRRDDDADERFGHG
jgi:hypothetical protein